MELLLAHKLILGLALSIAVDVFLAAWLISKASFLYKRVLGKV